MARSVCKECKGSEGLFSPLHQILHLYYHSHLSHPFWPPQTPFTSCSPHTSHLTLLGSKYTICTLQPWHLKYLAHFSPCTPIHCTLCNFTLTPPYLAPFGHHMSDFQVHLAPSNLVPCPSYSPSLPSHLLAQSFITITPLTPLISLAPLASCTKFNYSMYVWGVCVMPSVRVWEVQGVWTVARMRGV